MERDREEALMMPVVSVPADRVRVLFVMIQMAMGGSERLIHNLCRSLDRRVFEPSIAWLTPDPPLPEFESLDVPLYCVPKRNRFDWHAIRALAAIIRRHRIDVVNAHHFLPFFYAYYGAQFANRAALLYTEHAVADVLAIDGRWRTVGGLMLRSAAGAVGVSAAVSEVLQTHFQLDSQRVHTIDNGVDLDMFGQHVRARSTLRTELGLSRDDVVIGHLANFRRNKNHLFLLRAFQRVVRERPEAKLVLVGRGQPGDPENSEAETRDFIERERLGRSVFVLGYRSDVDQFLGMLDLFCLVSYREGLPLSLVEAMATGLPVVGTDVAGIRDVIQPEINGLTVASDDVPALARALQRLVVDAALRQRFGHASRRLAEDKYSLTRCVHQTEEMFRSLVPGRPVPVLARASRVA
jgi:L-malate glycosyltransferase